MVCPNLFKDESISYLLNLIIYILVQQQISQNFDKFTR